MRIPVDSTAQIGAVLRLVRKTQGVRSDDLAGAAGVGPVFVIDVEKGNHISKPGLPNAMHHFRSGIGLAPLWKQMAKLR